LQGGHPAVASLDKLTFAHREKLSSERGHFERSLRKFPRFQDRRAAAGRPPAHVFRHNDP